MHGPICFFFLFFPLFFFFLFRSENLIDFFFLLHFVVMHGLFFFFNFFFRKSVLVAADIKALTGVLRHFEDDDRMALHSLHAIAISHLFSIQPCQSIIYFPCIG